MEASSEKIAYESGSQANTAFVEGLKDVTFGSAAGMVSKVFEHPFDLCKVRLQSQVLDQTARFTGPIDCLTQTWKKEGIRGLYRGLPAPIVGAMAENSALFLAYGQLQKLVRWSTGENSAELRLPQLALAAAGAGSITSFLLTPIELVKCRMQVQMLAIGSPIPPPLLKLQDGAASSIRTPSSPKPALATSARTLPGPFSIISNIIRTKGIRGLWLGQTGTLIRETGGSAAWFSAKEAVASYLLSRRASTLGVPRSSITKADLQMWESALAGAVAGVAYNAVLFPADSVKSAIQTEEELRAGREVVRGGSRIGGVHGGSTPTFWKMAKRMYAKQGVRGLYAGCGITVARAVPSSAMIFLIYDGLTKRFSP